MNLDLDEKKFHRDLQRLNQICGHSNVRWRPIDWQAAGHSIPDRICALAGQFPNRPAVYDTETQLTYGELDHAANGVAHAILAARGQGQEAVVLLFDVGVTAIIAGLGVFRSNKYYVGLEPSFPMSRSVQIIEDAEAQLILTDTDHLKLAYELAGTRHQVLNLDKLAAIDGQKPDIDIPLSSIAMLNYTSGSTGRPKGVVHSHRSALAQVVRYANAYQISDADRVTSFGSLAWAGSLWDVFAPLSLGACVAAYDVRRHGLHKLGGWLEETGVTVMSGMLTVLRAASGSVDRLVPAVRLIELGGDTVYRRDVEACQRVFPNAIIAVGLGITEAGRVAELFIAPGTGLEQEVVPIGFPVSGVRLLIVSEDGNEVSPGDVGEIVVQSNHMAQGYWRQPTLTAAKFQCNPRYGDERVYFTGDLGRRLADGCYQHVGREDFQIKVRGYQVPANEIEATLLDIDGVRDACVVAQTSVAGNQLLVAYLASDQSASLTVDSLRSKFSEDLPDYMIPQRFIHVESLPKTPSGKIDRRALTISNFLRPNLANEYVAPCTPFEMKLASIWEAVLGIEEVGLHDDFLALGGDSLLAARIVSCVVQSFNIELSPGDVLASHTVAEMATMLVVRGVEQLPPEQLTNKLGGLQAMPGVMTTREE